MTVSKGAKQTSASTDAHTRTHRPRVGDVGLLLESDPVAFQVPTRHDTLLSNFLSTSECDLTVREFQRPNLQDCPAPGAQCMVRGQRGVIVLDPLAGR